MDIARNLYILKILKESFGENLTDPIIKSSISFSNYWTEFEEIILQHKILTNPDPKRLAQARGVDLFQKTRIFSFLNIIFQICGIIFLFFNWKVSIVLFAILLTNFIYKKSLKKRLIQNEINIFNDIMMNKENDTERFIEIIKYYCTGGIQLITDKGTAFLPLLPETCITGVQTFPHHKYEEEKKILENYKE